MPSRAVNWIKGALVEGPFPRRRAIAYRGIVTLAIVTATAIGILNTSPGMWGAAQSVADLVEWLALLVMAIDYGLRLMLSWRPGDGDSGFKTLLRYALSPYGTFDFVAVVPLLIGTAIGLGPDGNTVCAIFSLLKMARYSPALETLGVVVMSEFRPLMASLFIMALLAVFTSTALYFVERSVNPGFASVPEAMWWSVVTLATLGYGDVVPMTVLGKILGGVVAILGLCMFALPASILASGFNEEMRRQNFVSTWHLVAKVPFFTKLQAAQIAEIASLLKIYRAVTGEVMMREGDMGETMYFIVSGQMEVRTAAANFVLKAGDFFGEIALIEQRPRTATVKALTRAQLLILDARDFQKFAAGYPALMEAISRTARSRLSIHDGIQ